MGFLRRAIPKPARRVMHPVSSARRAATPKPIKKAMRATHPVGAAQTKAEDAAFGLFKTRKRNRRTPAPQSANVLLPPEGGKAGWHRDPLGSTSERYFNGSQWELRVRKRPRA